MRGRPPVLRDDVGKPIFGVSRLDLLETVKHESQERRTLRRLWFLVFPAVMLGVFIWSGFTARSLVATLPGLVVYIAVVAFTRIGVGHREARGMASLLRVARCGACGFPLQDLHADADGCVTCPECSAAWNSDRWRTHAAIANTLAINALERGTQTSNPRHEVDDRGALLPAPAMWKPAWRITLIGKSLTGALSPEYIRAFRAFDTTAGSQASAIWKSFWLVVLVATVSVGVVVAFNHEALFLIAVLIVLTSLAVYLVGEHVRRRVDVRAIALNNRLCPACGWLLDVPQQPQFDGCIQCPECASAWKAADVLEPEPGSAVAVPPAFAYRLGRAISNMGRDHD